MCDYKGHEGIFVRVELLCIPIVLAGACICIHAKTQKAEKGHFYCLYVNQKMGGGICSMVI